MELSHCRWGSPVWTSVMIASLGLGLFMGAAYAAPDISVRYLPLQVNEVATNLSLSADGRYLAYQAATADLAVNIVVLDLINNTRSQANLTPAGGLPTGAKCYSPVMSADGRYVVFSCIATSMGTPPPPGGQSYYVYDRVHNKTDVVNTTTSNPVARGVPLAISADGHYFVYRGPDGSGGGSLFVRNMVNKTTRAFTPKSFGASGGSINVSSDGRFISYDGRPNLASIQTDVSVYDVSTGTTEDVNVSTAGVHGTKGAGFPAMSADGSIVAFLSSDPALTSPPAPIYGGVFIRDRKAKTTEFVTSVVPTGFTSDPTLSANGRYVSFTGNPVQTVKNLYVYDRLTKVSRIIPGAIAGNRSSNKPKFSADGRYLAFESSVGVFGGTPIRSIGIADLGAAAGLTVSADALSLTEGGAAGTYSVVLAQVPNADVTVTVSPDKQLSVARTKLVFTPDNWNVPQLVSVQALQDGVAEGKHNGVITHTVTSTDIDYTVVKPSSVTVAINDAVVPTVVLPGATWNQSELPVSGTAAPGANVLLTATNRSTGWLTSVSVLADAQGNWSRTLSGLSDGVIEIDAQADGIHSAVQSITVALLPPPPISLPPPQQ